MTQSLQLIMGNKVFSAAVWSMRFISRNTFLVYLDTIAMVKHLGTVYVLTPLTDLSCAVPMLYSSWCGRLQELRDW